MISCSHGPGATVRVERLLSVRKPGGPRSLAVARARRGWICQWDADDRHYPERPGLPRDAMAAEDVAVNFLVGRQYWLRAGNVLCWDDRDRELCQMNAIEGTIFARKDVLPAYPVVASGEDTMHSRVLLRAAAEVGFRVSRPRGAR